MGDRTAFSTKGREFESLLGSSYRDLFLNGATIYPRSFYFVSLKNSPAAIKPNICYWIETDSDQAKDAKPPYKDVHMSGRVEGRFLYRSAIAKHVLPFIVLDPAFVILPLTLDGGKLALMSAEDLTEQGYRETAAWMKCAEQYWNTHRGRKADRMSLYEWLDYNGKLTNQEFSAPYLVLYNAAGTNISAAVFARKDCPQPFVVDHKLYYFATRTRSEADYLAAILNSATVNELIKPFQSVGLQGERDIHKKALELPIPRFDGRKSEHVALAKLGADARKKAARVVASAKSEGWPDGLARRRAIVRGGVSGLLEEIDAAVRSLFGIPAD